MFLGLKVPLMAKVFRGPVLNCQITPSVSPRGWQLAQLWRPFSDMRSRLDPMPDGFTKLPRDERNNSAPTNTFSASEPGGGKSAVRMTLTTLSASRSTTDTLRDT